MIILASNSPRRKELLKKINLDFIIDPSNYQEDMTLDLTPQELVKELSLGKAKEVSLRHPNDIIIGADTIIEYKGEVIGKPFDRQEAIKILSKLNNDKNHVITGYTIIDVKNNKTISRAVSSTVIFKNNSLSQIKKYVDLDKPFDKAGAYAIFDPHNNLIKKIIGDKDSITGLPLKNLISDLRQFQINVLH
jgi:septum formation protein